MLYYISYSLFGQSDLCSMRTNGSFKVISAAFPSLDRSRDY